MKKLIFLPIILLSYQLFSQTYDPDAAAEYAREWCDKRNTRTSPYYDQSRWGGPYHDYGLDYPKG